MNFYLPCNPVYMLIFNINFGWSKNLGYLIFSIHGDKH